MGCVYVCFAGSRVPAFVVAGIAAVCRLKSHKRCVGRVSAVCKWTTLASVGDDVIEDHRTGVRTPS